MVGLKLVVTDKRNFLRLQCLSLLGVFVPTGLVKVRLKDILTNM